MYEENEIKRLKEIKIDKWNIKIKNLKSNWYLILQYNLQQVQLIIEGYGNNRSNF